MDHAPAPRAPPVAPLATHFVAGPDCQALFAGRRCSEPLQCESAGSPRSAFMACSSAYPINVAGTNGLLPSQSNCYDFHLVFGVKGFGCSCILLRFILSHLDHVTMDFIQLFAVKKMIHCVVFFEPFDFLS